MANTEKTPQIERFRETGRRLGCDEDKERFEAALGKIAVARPRRASNEEVGPKAKAIKSPKSRG